MKPRTKKLLAANLLMLAGFAANPNADAARAGKPAHSFINDDDRFMALRDAALHDDDSGAQQHAAALANYEIPSYVAYYRLRPHLYKAGAAEVEALLKQYEGSAIADRLRNDWLLVLGKRGEWEKFDAHYAQFVLGDDTQLKCYALLSKATRQQMVAREARALLNSPGHFGEGCTSLVGYLFAQRQFSEQDIWQQIRLAAEHGALPLAQRLGKLLALPDKKLAQAFEKPVVMLKKAPEGGASAHQLYLIALARLARQEPEDAAAVLIRHSGKFNEAERALGWAQIALRSSLKLEADAERYWTLAGAAPLSHEGYQWRVRSALRAGDWARVQEAIAAMPAALKADPAWVYWQGRALAATGRGDEAHALFGGIAGQMHFYGQLALEELGQKIGAPAAARPVSAEELAQVAQNQNLQRALKFYRMNLRLEGTREWNWELRKLNERQHLAAAELARQNELLDRMVNTSERTRDEMDFSQRYPTPFNDSMYKTTQALGLDMAWVYGLIRQESRFVMRAKSQVGASGLMQVMPATARYVAKKIGLGGQVPQQLNEVETNITLGTNYLNMVLTDLGGSQALASAAYNAGPGRPRAWRATLTRPVEGAIFTESIPFTETRGYVKNVLANATYYAAMLEKKPQSLKARLGTVAPKGVAIGAEP